MKKYFFLCIFLLVFSQMHANSAMVSHFLSSTEADPDSFIDHQVNVIHGDYCEVVTDLVIKSPDNLVMQRYYSNSNYITGEEKGGWRIFPQCWLTIGKGNDSIYALTGERSGSLLTYHGRDDVAGLKVDVSSGISNTAKGEISGKSNLQNNLLKSQEQGYLLTLGDGTRRYFEKVNTLPISHPGIELHESFSKKIKNPESYHLVLEILPSGNKLRYEYNDLGQLISLTMVNSSEKKILSWIHFKHEKHKLYISTSDEKTITYHVDGSFIRNIEYSDKPSCSYQYNEQGKLIQKAVSDKILELDYDAQGRVVCLKEMLDSSEELSPSKTFSYRKGVTEVCNALGQKTAYLYNKRNQLEAIERYDLNGIKYRTDRKFWEGINLFASTIEDGKSNTLSYRSYTYDEQGNVIEERLYGNLTGKINTYLQMGAHGQLIANEDTECHVKKVEYSKDGFNLVAKIGDCKGNEILFEYLL